MNLIETITFEQIEQTAANLKTARPAYGQIIDFYREVFIAQEKSKQALNLDPIVIDDKMLQLKRDNEMPIISQNEFVIDYGSSLILMDSICSLTIDHASQLASSAGILKKKIKENELVFKDILNAVLSDDHEMIQDKAEEMHLLASELTFFAISSMLPSIQTCTTQLSVYLNDQTWNKMYCPICGKDPDIGFLDENGKKHLVCSFCTNTWDVKRMGCTFCDTVDSKQQHYFFSDEEKEYRVDLCDNCQKYLKMIDLREITRKFYPPLEQISTLHLDMKAQEKGYKQ